MKRARWAERTFELQLPVGVFPMVLERVRGTPARLEEAIRSCPEHILTARTGDAWSIQEHAGHLLDLEELHEGRIDDFLARAQVLRAADMENKKTFAANHNARRVGDILNAFRKSRERFVDRLESLDDATHEFAALHPRLKQSMRPVDFAYFVAEHDDHHLARIREAGRALGKIDR